MAYLLAAAIIIICFTLLGLGILFFGRKDISSECGTVPNHPDAVCPSKEAGICPTENKQNEALDMALTFSKFHKLKKRDGLANSSNTDQTHSDNPS